MSRLLREMRETMDKLTAIAEAADQEEYGRNAVVVAAYSENPKYRKLDVRGQPCDVEDWHGVMVAAAPMYNDFDIGNVYPVLQGLPRVDELLFIPGREGSVVLYITTGGDEVLAQEVLQYLQNNKLWLKYDELDLQDGSTIRIWWD